MILYQNYEIIVSVFFYFASKFLSLLAPMYHDKRVSKLSAIPEKNETEHDEKRPELWVPKKKHDVLKAKYKCLKKLFQIYDASVIGILPQGVTENVEVEETPRRRIKRRSHHKPRTDACTSVINTSADDAKVLKDSENNTDDTNDTSRSFTSIQVETIAKSLLKIPTILKDDKCIQDSIENIPKRSNSAPETNVKPTHVSVLCEKRKSRFQNYFQRLFGLKTDKIQEVCSQEYQNWTRSDNNISSNNNINKRRKRKAFKVTTPRRSRHVSSELNLRDVDILSHIQLIQRQCLLDRTQRQCPCVNCKMMTSGIINYNDHLNLCHFPERKYICHYCHEGFTDNKDRLIHENEHIGINKLTPNHNNNKEQVIKSDKTVSVTQTEPGISEEKLLRIMSLIERIPDPIPSEKDEKAKKTQDRIRDDEKCVDSGSCGKKTSSWPNFSASAKGTKGLSKSASERSPRTTVDSNFSCKMCGEEFGNRRYLQFHVDVDHRDVDINNLSNIAQKPLNFTSKTGQLSINDSYSLSQAPSSSSFECRKRDAVSYDPSTNIIYYTSLESIDESSNEVDIGGYKWESETKIIRV